MRTRFTRNKRHKIVPWPAGAPEPTAVAESVWYVGSNEHKDHPSAVGPPALRSDASPCPVHLTRDTGRNTRALRHAILEGCVGGDFQGGFPRYVWTWIEGHVYEARHINGPQGTYKGYRLESIEWPIDEEGRLGEASPGKDWSMETPAGPEGGAR